MSCAELDGGERLACEGRLAYASGWDEVGVV
jgi:hypothetical protein